MDDNKNWVSEIENMLKLVPGVLAAKVVLNQEQGQENDINEIHILSTTERNAKQISRDVQSIIVAKFNLDLDHKKISIAQIEHHDNLKPQERIKIDSINYFVNGNRVKAEVKLQYRDNVYSAVEEGPNTLLSTYRIIANATLNAVHQIIDQDHIFAIEDVEKVYVGKKEVIIVAISVINYDYEEMFVGTAIIKGDAREAAVRATLDALNRRLAKFS